MTAIQVAHDSGHDLLINYLIDLRQLESGCFLVGPLRQMNESF